MKTYRLKSAIAVQVVTIILICTAVIIVRDISIGLNWDSISILTSVIGIYTIVHIIFVKWLWRLRIFSGWLVIAPNIQGTWKGEVETTWKDPSLNKSVSPVYAYLVIRQDLNKVHIAMFSLESSSQSLVAAIKIDEERGIKLLNYSYTNNPRAVVRDRSEIHHGAANLKIITKPDLRLVGDYWTDRKTTGSMKFEFISTRLIEAYPRDSENVGA